MNCYLVYRTDVRDFDEYELVVVVAKDETDALRIVAKECKGVGHAWGTKEGVYGNNVKIKKVDMEEAGVVCENFNNG